MLDLTEQKENVKPGPTYVPEIDETVFTDKDNSAAVVKEMDLLRQNGVADLYFGNTRLNTESQQPSWIKTAIGYPFKMAGTAFRGAERGTVKLGESIAETWKMGESEFYQIFSELESRGAYRDQIAWLNANKNAGTISQEEYDNGIKQANDQLEFAVQWDMRQKDTETKKIKKYYEKMQLWNTRVSKNFARQDWENKGLPKYVADMFESAPSTVGAMAAFLITKNPAVAAMVYGGTAVPQEIADLAKTELEQGANVEEALGTASITTIPVAALDFASLAVAAKLWMAPMNKFVTKSKVFAAMQNFAYKNRYSKNIWNNLGAMVRVGAVTAAEEAPTETVQGVLENNLPRVIGYGPEFNSFFDETMDYFYQGLVGGGMGFLMGGVGSSVSLYKVRNHIAEQAQKPLKDGGAGLNKEEAQSLAEEVAPVIVAHGEEFSNALKKEIDNMDISESAAKVAVEKLLGGFTREDSSEMVKLLETSLDQQYPKGKGNANSIVAQMLYVQAKQMAEAEGCSIEEAVTQQRIRIVDDPSSLDVSDKFYNARNSKGEVVGATSKNITDNLIYLLNTATPDVLVHEATHLFLKNITAMIRSGKVNAKFSATIGNVLDFLGAPEGENYEFSDAQQERLANMFQEIAKSGVAPTAELDESFIQLSQMVATAYNSARKTKQLTPQAKQLFADFFGSRKADSNIPVSSNDVARLQEAVDKILRGERVAVKDLNIIKNLIKWRGDISPLLVGYSVSDFIKDNPEYNELDNVGKLAMLQAAGFTLDNVLPEGATNVAETNREVNSSVKDAVSEESTLRPVKEIEAELDKAVETNDVAAISSLNAEQADHMNIRENLVLRVAQAKGWRGAPTTSAEGRSASTASRYIQLTNANTGKTITVRLSDHANLSQNAAQKVDGTLLYQNSAEQNAKELEAILDKNDSNAEEGRKRWEDFRNKVASGDIISDIEAQADEIFLASDEKAQARRKEVKRYRQVQKVYEAVFGKDNVKAGATAKAIGELQRKGYVVTDKASMEKLAKDLKIVRAGIDSLENKLEASRSMLKEQKAKTKAAVEKGKTKAQEIKEEAVAKQAKETAKSSLRHIDAVISLMGESGMDVSELESESNEISVSLEQMSPEEIKSRVKNLFEKTQVFSDQLLKQYYSSETFIQQEGIQPPVMRKAELAATISNAYAKSLSKTGKPFDYRLFEIKLQKALRKFGVTERYANMIMTELRKANSYQGSALRNALDKIEVQISEQYKRMMADKYEKHLSELKAKAKSRTLHASDNVAINYISKKIKLLETAYAESKGRSSFDRKMAVDEALSTIDFNNDIIGKDENGKDVKLNEQQKAVANAFISQKVAQLKNDVLFPDEELMKGFQTISEFSEISISEAERVLTERQQAFNEMVKRAYLTVSRRKELPKALKAVDSGWLAGLLGGLRSNLIAVFGEELANEFDVTIQYRKAGIRVRDIKDRVAEKMGVVLRDKRLVAPYVERLDLDKPYAKADDEVGKLLKDYTRGQILDLYLIALNGKSTAPKGKWYNPESAGYRWIARTFGKNTQAVLDRINSGMSELDKAYGAILMGELEAIYPDLAQTYYKMNGRPMGYQDGYWPLYTMLESDSSAPIRDDLSVFNFAPVTKEETAATRERTKVSMDPEVNPTRVLKLDSPTEKFSRYINTVTKFQYVVPKLNVISEAIFGNSEQSKALRKLITDKYGKGMLDALRKDFAYNLGVMPYEEISAFYKICHEVLNNYIFGALFKASIAFRQSLGMFLYSDSVQWKAFIPNLLSGLLLHPLQTWEEMMSLPSVRNRFIGELPMALTQEKSFTTSWLPKLLGLKGKKGGAIAALLKKARTGSTYPTRFGDALAVVYGGYAYMKAREQELMQDPAFASLSKEEQKKVLENEFIIQTETTQQSGFGSTKGSLQRSEGGGAIEMLGKRMFMIFSSFNVQVGRKLREGVYEYMNGDMTKGQLAKRASIFLVLNAMLYSFFSQTGTWVNAIRRMLNGDERWKDDIYLTVVRPMLDQFMAVGGLFGEIPMYFADLAAEGVGQRTFGARVINMTPFFIENTSKKFGKKNKDVDDWIEAFLSAAQGVSPIPLESTKRMTESAVKAAGGKDPAVNLLMLFGYSENQAKKIVGD